jgi:hypothetical protein
MVKVQNVLDILAMPQITDGQIYELKRFCNDNATSSNKAELILQVQNYLSYANWFQKHKSNLGALMPAASRDVNSGMPSQIGIVSADSVLSKFVSAYTSCDDNSSNDLINALLQSFACKMNGRMNAPYMSNLIDLCQVIRHKSNAAYSFLRENLLLPSVRHLV